MATKQITAGNVDIIFSEHFLRAYPDNHSSARDRASRLWTRKAKQTMFSIVDAV
ncbi:MAG: hypothetical protein IIB56_19935 [Planctomycetes bacterium]|nr:hypothetical protein [Planctomycetota bacterium]